MTRREEILSMECLDRTKLELMANYCRELEDDRFAFIEIPRMTDEEKQRIQSGISDSIRLLSEMMPNSGTLKILKGETDTP